MSAIWGVIDFSENAISEDVRREMETAYCGKKIDRIDTGMEDGVYLGCGLQYVTREAELEKFPYTDDNGNILVADVILDNRMHCQNVFTMRSDKSEDGVDGSILFDAVSQDFNRALNEMLGAYVFALYNKKEKTVRLVSDAVGNRSVYYCYIDGKVYFSSLLEPLRILCKCSKRNDIWYKNYFSQDDLRVVAEARETPFKEIYRVEPGEVVTVSADGIQRNSYWNPFRICKEKRNITDEECKTWVNSVMKECVESYLRDGTDIAILLSGGLDSNAVAAYAAPKLKEQGRKLYSFTSVPDKRASRIPKNSYYVEDETEYIEELVRWHDNLEPEYIDASEGDLLKENRYLQGVYEIPFKTVLNMPWIYRAYSMAADKGCGILLSGQYGNITISYGDFECLFLTLLKKGQIILLWKEVTAYAQRYRKSRKWLLKELWKNRHGESFKKMKLYMYDKVALRQVGETELKASLATGVIPRDPTRDKRVIEMILSLPQEQFVRMGHARRLVREYMKDLIPVKIAQDDFHRGRQGVGSRRLMEEQRQYIFRDIGTLLKRGAGSTEMASVCDFAMLAEQCEQICIGKMPENSYEMVKLIYSGLTYEFMENKHHE